MKLVSNGKIIKLFLGIVFFVASFTANAVPIVQGPLSAVSGITGLDVDGTLYDVTFVNDSYNNVFSSSTPTFFGDGASAQAAAIAMVNVFNSLSVTGILDLTDINGSPIYIDIPTAESVGFYDTWSAFLPSGATWDSGFTAGVLGGDFSQISTAFATFTLASGSGNGGSTQVSEPATLALMSLGLFGLGFMRKRK